jgi:hypothetical protein
MVKRQLSINSRSNKDEQKANEKASRLEKDAGSFLLSS